MLKLDNNLLQELGLGSLPEDQKKAMLQHIYDTLELRVGTQLANQMTDQQLQEFEQFIDSGGDASQAQALQWLETNLPNYKQVVNDVFEALKGEIKQMSAQITAAAAGQPAAPQMSAPDPYQQPAAPQGFSQPAQPVEPQFGQPQQPAYAAPAPQQLAADPYQPAAPAPGPMPAPQTGYPQPAQPVQPQSFGQQPGQQPQFTQPDPLQQFGPQPAAPQGGAATPPYSPQQPAAPQFPGQQPPAGPGQ